MLRTISGRRYFVEGTDVVASLVWDKLGEITADADNVTFTLETPVGNQRFWRYRATP